LLAHPPESLTSLEAPPIFEAGQCCLNLSYPGSTIESSSGQRAASDIEQPKIDA
jgi:hypothetical protein